MRSLLFIFIVCINISSSILGKADACTIILDSCWQILDTDRTKDNQIGSWILVGSITCKKKTKERITLSTLQFQWHGNKLASLLGSLYQKNINKPFMPIEQNLVCDSIWHVSEQQLIFNFREKLTLNPVTTLYLVLVVPPSLAPVLQNGYFSLKLDALPPLLQSVVSIVDVRITCKPIAPQDALSV